MWPKRPDCIRYFCSWGSGHLRRLWAVRSYDVRTCVHCITLLWGFFSYVIRSNDRLRPTVVYGVHSCNKDSIRIHAHVLTEHFTILEPRNPSVEECFAVQKRGSTNVLWFRFVGRWILRYLNCKMFRRGPCTCMYVRTYDRRVVR